ncbi:MAG: YraN family protein [Candidatus Zambryskibacteria bacterium]|nr:YraN family protein [Candidatus Zambryskibacteria bacterium]
MFGKNEQKEPTEKQKIGKMGEDYACEYLKMGGYKIINRNYLRKWGELDIVARKGNKIHFVEVKSVSRDLSAQADIFNDNVIRETNDSYRAEDNMHPWKLKRLGRAIQSYLLEKDISDDIDWQFDVITVYIDINKGISKVFILDDVIL